MGVRLVALDIDGTIVPKESPHGLKLPLPSARIRRAVRTLQRAGIAVVLATGRMYRGTAAVARALELETPLICQQGCAIHNPDGSLRHVFRIDGSIARDVAAFARERGHPYEWFDPFRYVVSRPTPESALYARLSGVEPEYHPSPEALGFVPTGVGIISTPSEAPEVHRQLQALHGEAVHLLDFPSVTVAVAPEANKGHALALVAAELGVDREEVVAVGDSVNDAPMLAWAGLGLTVAHADRYARDAADNIVGEGEDDVAAFLEALASRARRR
ncbi:Phosphatase YwpJ [bacterium HR29]|jgi:hydroxymethylpyrimidine pyrophosphatase-like HAD family hydrolase|nr:Phosphatase YwpJ [bacterium HR29]